MTLKRFARSREKAYRLTGNFDLTRAKAVGKIRRVADFFKDKPANQQTVAVRQCITELYILLPTKGSRFGHLRQQILTLIDSCHARPVT